MSKSEEREDEGIDLRTYRVPGFCPICKVLMRGDKSSASYYQYGCCSHCFIQWVDGREHSWREGRRPTDEQIKRFVAELFPSTLDES